MCIYSIYIQPLTLIFVHVIFAYCNLLHSTTCCLLTAQIDHLMTFGCCRGIATLGVGYMYRHVCLWVTSWTNAWTNFYSTCNTCSAFVCICVHLCVCLQRTRWEVHTDTLNANIFSNLTIAILFRSLSQQYMQVAQDKVSVLGLEKNYANLAAASRHLETSISITDSSVLES